MPLTVELHALAVRAESVLGDARVVSVVAVSDVHDAEAERDGVVLLVVGVEAVLCRAHDALAALAPEVDGHGVGGDLTLEDRILLQLLADAECPQTDLRGNCSGQR